MKRSLGAWVCAAAALPLAAQQCSPSWSQAFGANALDGAIYAFAAHDDGSGPGLFVGGAFTQAGGAGEHVACWRGQGWTPVGGGLNGLVLSLAEHDAGGGAQLYAGGSFLGAAPGAQDARRIARWDGAQWSALGSGANNTVRALASFDDGSGAALYAGGDFLSIGGIGANRIARWDGAQWHALGAGLGSSVTALAVHDDGSGAALYAGGFFLDAGGQSAPHIARWQGGQWQAVGAGLPGAVFTLASWNGALGARLVAGGSFALPGGTHAASFDGAQWSPLGGGLDAPVQVLRSGHDPLGIEVLYAGGGFNHAGGASAYRVARYDGGAWSAVGDGDAWFAPAGGLVYALNADPLPGESQLFAGGSFSAQDQSQYFAQFDQGKWSAAAGGLDGAALALASYDDGAGSALFAAGEFTHAGSSAVNHIARWSGSGWSALADGLDGPARALAVFDDGQGPELYVGGAFAHAGSASHGVLADNLARWNGAAWSSVAGGLDGEVRALALHDDGFGAALYAGGAFAQAGGAPAARVARFRNGAWSALGSGCAGTVHALASFASGGASRLYAGGDFLAAGALPAAHLARWDGASWSALGSGTDARVRALAVLAPFGAARLAIGGEFALADGLPVHGIASFDGAHFAVLESAGNSLGNGAEVRALAAAELGDGAMLIAGGRFHASQGAPADHLARFDGALWLPLAGGVDAEVDSLLAQGASPAAQALFAGGAFAHAGGASARGLAELDGCAQSMLSVNTPAISLALGGQQRQQLEAGAGFAGALYFVLGSASGTSPGIAIDGLVLPLVPDAWFLFALSAPNQGFYAANLGQLDGLGAAQSKLSFPAGLPAALAGAQLFHAAAVLDVFAGQVVLTSNAVALTLVP